MTNKRTTSKAAEIECLAALDLYREAVEVLRKINDIDRHLDYALRHAHEERIRVKAFFNAYSRIGVITQKMYQEYMRTHGEIWRKEDARIAEIEIAKKQNKTKVNEAILV